MLVRENGIKKFDLAPAYYSNLHKSSLLVNEA